MVLVACPCFVITFQQRCWWSWEEKKRWAAKKTKTVTKCQGECYWSVRFWVNEQVVTLWATEQSQTLTHSDNHMSRYTQAISFAKVLCQSSCSFLLLPSYLFHSESHVNSDSMILLKVSLFLHLLMKVSDRSETTSNNAYQVRAYRLRRNLWSMYSYISVKMMQIFIYLLFLDFTH